MKITTLIRMVYLFFGVLCFIGMPFERLDGVQSFAKLYGGLVCFSFIGLDCLPTKPISRVVTTIFLLSVAMTMLFPFTVLSVWPELYLQAGKTLGLKYQTGVPLLLHIKMLSYILALGSAFAISARMLEGLVVARPVDRLPPERSDLLNRFNVWVCMAILANIFNIVFERATGMHTYDSSVGQWGLLSRLFAPELMGYVCLYAFMRYRKLLTPINIGLFAILCVVYFAAGFLAGQRGVMLKIPYYLVLIALFLDIRAVISWKVLSLGLFMIIFVLPFGFTAVSKFKDITRDRNIVKESFSVETLNISYDADVYYRMFGWIGGRFSGYQVFIASEQGFGDVVRSMSGPLQIIETTINTIMPDRILPKRYPSLGIIASMVLSGHNPDEVKHAGNFFGVTMIWLFLRYWIFAGFIVMLSAFFVMYNKMINQSDYLSCILCFLSVQIFQVMLSGNVDSIVGNFVTSIIIVSSIWYFMRIFFGAGVKIR